jgi:hypothetical protein
MLSRFVSRRRLLNGAALLFGLAAPGGPTPVAPVLGGPAAQATPSAQTVSLVFHADFSRWAGPPLVKTKFGVYETPFLAKDDLRRAADLLPEAGVQDLRYETGWGKPDTYAFDQIGGTAAAPTIDFTALDPFVRQLKTLGIAPLFAMTYDPVPLKTGTEWQRWKDMPSSLAAWQEIQRRYAAHYRDVLHLGNPRYEIWNEPDIGGDGGKMFFNGTPAQYADLYRAGAAGIHAGDADALAGGPAIAYDHAYATPILSMPLDFVSIHAYDNYAGQLGGMQKLVADRPELPILLTEYASFTQYGPDAPVSRHQAAERFFRDVQGLLDFTDVPKVYWAQWVDDSIGLITRDWHRKALFNAYKVYQTMLPVDRNPVSPDGADGVGLMAASDDHTAGVVLWNENADDRTCTIHLDRLPFAHGSLVLHRIDASHASYVDDHATENLTTDGVWKITSARASWTGTVPAESVVYLHASDGSGQSLLRPTQIGTFVRDHVWYPERSSDAYADFDPRTAIARVGLGRRAVGTAQIGVVIDSPVRRLRVQIKRHGPFAPQDTNSLFGLRVDYAAKGGGFARSVLWHDGSCRAARTAPLPWGKGRATADEMHVQGQMRTGVPFTLDIAKEAPKDWNGRIILTPILQDMGAGSCARFTLEDADRQGERRKAP